MERESESHFGQTSTCHTDATVSNTYVTSIHVFFSTSHHFAPWKKEFSSEIIVSLYHFRSPQIILKLVNLLELQDTDLVDFSRNPLREAVSCTIQFFFPATGELGKNNNKMKYMHF